MPDLVPDLIPSQVKQTSTAKQTAPATAAAGDNNLNQNTNNKRRRRRRKGRGPASQSQSQEEQAQEEQAGEERERGQKEKAPPPPPNKSKKKSKKKKVQAREGQTEEEKERGQEEKIPPPQNKSKNKSKNKKKHPWRKHIKKGVVDPISLEPLVKLPYPPFALAITEPYIPIPIWPPPEGPSEGNDNDDETKKINETKERRQKKLEEQWGLKLPSKIERTTPGATTAATTSIDNEECINESVESKYSQKIKESPDIKEGEDGKETNKHVHLFDGRVLACYLVSQLQFIDPLNRRDLTREEIINLDSYLQRHKLKQASVLEAYDSKGITLSSAGISGQTRSGRAEILQQEAQLLLNSLFRVSTPGQSNTNDNNNSSSNNNNNNNNIRTQRNRRRRNNRRDVDNENQFLRQYAAFESNGRDNGVQAGRQRVAQNNDELFNDQMRTSGEGLYTHGDGMVIIDDNINPGLRGATDFSNAMNTLSRSSQNTQQTTWHGHRMRTQEDNFPALTPTVHEETKNVVVNSQPDKSASASNRKVSKSLLKIGKVVQKTNPKDVEKQRKARDEALRKMEIANLPYEEYIRRGKMLLTEQQNIEHGEGNATIPVGSSVPTEKQLERNKNLADALGVEPSTIRNKAKSFTEGWRRPTKTIVSLDEFGNELNSTEYPDELIVEAKERMTELLKLEKKWIAWLDDDKTASCSLKKMDKQTRIFVHKYSDFWNIQTRSYDPEPRRYIHCVKMLETYAPRPLLSEAVRNWRGPASKGTNIAIYKESTEDIASSTTRELPLTEDRIPLKLSSRSIPTGEQAVTNESSPSGYPQTNVQYEVHQPNERFASLITERERTKLTLEPRTKPLELPPYQPSQKKIDEHILEKRNKITEAEKLKIYEQEERKRRILEAAFASDDEPSCDSDWEIGEALYSGSDEE